MAKQSHTSTPSNNTLKTHQRETLDRLVPSALYNALFTVAHNNPEFAHAAIKVITLPLGTYPSSPTDLSPPDPHQYAEDFLAALEEAPSFKTHVTPGLRYLHQICQMEGNPVKHLYLETAAEKQAAKEYTAGIVRPVIEGLREIVEERQQTRLSPSKSFSEIELKQLQNALRDVDSSSEDEQKEEGTCPPPPPPSPVPDMGHIGNLPPSMVAIERDRDVVIPVAEVPSSPSHAEEHANLTCAMILCSFMQGVLNRTVSMFTNACTNTQKPLESGTWVDHIRQQESAPEMTPPGQRFM